MSDFNFPGISDSTTSDFNIDTSASPAGEPLTPPQQQEGGQQPPSPVLSTPPSTTQVDTSGLHPDLQARFNALRNQVKSKFGPDYDLMPTSGYRDYYKQAQLARSANRYPVAKPGTSKHETAINGVPASTAVDFNVTKGGVALPASDKANASLYSQVGQIAGDEAGLTWGGNFKRSDPVHLQVNSPTQVPDGYEVTYVDPDKVDEYKSKGYKTQDDLAGNSNQGGSEGPASAIAGDATNNQPKVVYGKGITAKDIPQNQAEELKQRATAAALGKLKILQETNKAAYDDPQIPDPNQLTSYEYDLLKDYRTPLSPQQEYGVYQWDERTHSNKQVQDGSLPGYLFAARQSSKAQFGPRYFSPRGIDSFADVYQWNPATQQNELVKTAKQAFQEYNQSGFDETTVNVTGKAMNEPIGDYLFEAAAKQLAKRYGYSGMAVESVIADYKKANGGKSVSATNNGVGQGFDTLADIKDSLKPDETGNGVQVPYRLRHDIINDLQVKEAKLTGGNHVFSDNPFIDSSLKGLTKGLFVDKMAWLAGKLGSDTYADAAKRVNENDSPESYNPEAMRDPATRDLVGAQQVLGEATGQTAGAIGSGIALSKVTESLIGLSSALGKGLLSVDEAAQAGKIAGELDEAGFQTLAKAAGGKPGVFSSVVKSSMNNKSIAQAVDFLGSELGQNLTHSAITGAQFGALNTGHISKDGWTIQTADGRERAVTLQDVITGMAKDGSMFMISSALEGLNPAFSQRLAATLPVITAYSFATNPSQSGADALTNMLSLTAMMLTGGHGSKDELSKLYVDKEGSVLRPDQINKDNRNSIVRMSPVVATVDSEGTVHYGALYYNGSKPEFRRLTEDNQIVQDSVGKIPVIRPDRFNQLAAQKFGNYTFTENPAEQRTSKVNSYIAPKELEPTKVGQLKGGDLIGDNVGQTPEGKFYVPVKRADGSNVRVKFDSERAANNWHDEAASYLQALPAQEAALDWLDTQSSHVDIETLGDKFGKDVAKQLQANKFISVNEETGRVTTLRSTDSDKVAEAINANPAAPVTSKIAPSYKPVFLGETYEDEKGTVVKVASVGKDTIRLKGPDGTYSVSRKDLEEKFKLSDKELPEPAAKTNKTKATTTAQAPSAPAAPRKAKLGNKEHEIVSESSNSVELSTPQGTVLISKSRPDLTMPDVPTTTEEGRSQLYQNVDRLKRTNVVAEHARYGPVNVLGTMDEGRRLLVAEEDGTPHIVQNPHGELGNKSFGDFDAKDLKKLKDIDFREIGLLSPIPTPQEISKLTGGKTTHLSEVDPELLRKHYPGAYMNQIIGGGELPPLVERNKEALNQEVPKSVSDGHIIYVNKHAQRLLEAADARLESGNGGLQATITDSEDLVDKLRKIPGTNNLVKQIEKAASTNPDGRVPILEVTPDESGKLIQGTSHEMTHTLGGVLHPDDLAGLPKNALDNFRKALPDDSYYKSVGDSELAAEVLAFGLSGEILTDDPRIQLEAFHHIAQAYAKALPDATVDDLVNIALIGEKYAKKALQSRDSGKRSSSPEEVFSSPEESGTTSGQADSSSVHELGEPVRSKRGTGNAAKSQPEPEPLRETATTTRASAPAGQDSLDAIGKIVEKKALKAAEKANRQAAGKQPASEAQGDEAQKVTTEAEKTASPKAGRPRTATENKLLAKTTEGIDPAHLSIIAGATDLDSLRNGMLKQGADWYPIAAKISDVGGGNFYTGLKKLQDIMKNSDFKEGDSLPDVLFRKDEDTAEKQPTFYSQLERTIESKLPAKATAEQLLGIISRPENGVKQDEIKWSGLDDFLQANKGHIRKSDLLNFIKENNVKLQEVEKGESESSKFNQAAVDTDNKFRELTRSLADKIHMGEDEFSHRESMESIWRYLRESELGGVVGINDFTGRVEEPITPEQQRVFEKYKPELDKVVEAKKAGDEAYDKANPDRVANKATDNWYAVVGKAIDALDAENLGPMEFTPEGEEAAKDWVDGLHDISNYGDVNLFKAKYNLPDKYDPYLKDIAEAAMAKKKSWDALDKDKAPNGSNTSYEKWASPGGSRYRELKLILDKGLNDTSSEQFALSNIRHQISEMNLHPENYPNWEEDINNLSERAQELKNKIEKSQSEKFTSSHWNEPNIIVHTRFNDRTNSAGERILHLEEVQSDWNQIGREQGFKDEVERGKLTKELAKYGVDPSDGSLSVDKLRNKNVPLDLENRWQEEYLKKSNGVPDSPFPESKNWGALALRRMLRYAAERGYDKLSWTTGDTQNDRYSLASHIDSLDYSQNPDGTYHLIGVKDGNVQATDGFDNIKPSELPNYVGQEIAAKIRAGETGGTATNNQGTLDNLDLQVGGAGMKGFYDKILVDYANRYAKKWGARVHDDSITTNKGETPVRPWTVVAETGFIAGWYKTEAEANKALKDVFSDSTYYKVVNQPNPPDQTEPVHAISITDSMKDAVMQGQPLFRKFTKPQLAQMQNFSDKDWKDFAVNVSKNHQLTPNETGRLNQLLDQGKNATSQKEKDIVFGRLTALTQNLQDDGWMKLLSNAMRVNLIAKVGVYAHIATNDILTAAMNELVERPIAATIDAVSSKALGKERVNQGTSAKGIGYSLGKVITEGIPRAVQVLAKGEASVDPNHRPLVARSGNPVAKALAFYANKVYDSHNAIYGLFEEYAKSRSLYEQASLGANTKAGKAALLAKPTPQMLDIAALAGLTASYRNDNLLTQQWNSARNKVEDNLGSLPAFAMDYAVPFPKMATNYFIRAIEYLPGLGLTTKAKAISDYKLDNVSRQAVNGALAKQLVGTSAFMLGMWLYHKGVLTGFREKDAKSVNMQELQGSEPSEVQIDGRWYPVDRLHPIARAMVVAASLARSADKSQTLAAQAKDAGSVFANLMETVPFVQTTSNLTDDAALSLPSVNTKDKSTAGKVAEVGAAVADKIGLQNRVLPGVVGEASTFMDPIKRDTRGDDAISTLKNKFLAQTPKSSSLPEKKDVFGEPVEKKHETTALSFLTGGSTKDKSSDPLYKELERTGFLPSKPAKVASKSTGGQKPDTSQLQTKEGKVGPAEERALTSAINSPYYKGEDKERHEQLRAVSNFVNQEVANGTKYTSVEEQHNVNALVARESTKSLLKKAPEYSKLTPEQKSYADSQISGYFTDAIVRPNQHDSVDASKSVLNAIMKRQTQMVQIVLKEASYYRK